MSVIAAFASFSSLAFFVALGFVGNGVITVMINSRRQSQTMMQITRAEIIAVTLLMRNLSDRSARFFEFCNQAVSLMLELTITSGSEAQILLQRLPDGYHHDQS